jgi:hypothetical protein
MTAHRPGYFYCQMSQRLPGARVHLVARTTAKKLGLSGASVSSRTNGPRYGANRIAPAGRMSAIQECPMTRPFGWSR